MATFDRVSWPVRTTRLEFRPTTEADVDEAWTYRRLDEVTFWMTSAWPSYQEFRDAWVSEDRLAKTLVIEHEGVLVGDLMLHVESSWAQREVEDEAKDVQAELGWCLHPAYAGKGLATEAVEALVRVCFEDLGLRRVTANCFADNAASWRLMERIGMRREVHTRQESLHRSLGWLDGYGYALLADEWRARRSGEVR
jgi:RimJ/RimL family protein N-acetyltransferase